jgi:hypothetical protein
LNDTVNKTWNDLDKARLERDRFLYSDDTGAAEIIQNEKKYESLYSAGSGEYKRISGIRFVKK